MFFVISIVITVMLLLAFALTESRGKHTAHARKNPPARVSEPKRPINSLSAAHHNTDASLIAD